MADGALFLEFQKPWINEETQVKSKHYHLLPAILESASLFVKGTLINL